MTRGGGSGSAYIKEISSDFSKYFVVLPMRGEPQNHKHIILLHSLSMFLCLRIIVVGSCVVSGGGLCTNAEVTCNITCKREREH